MVPSHSADEVAANRKGGEQSTQRWQGGEKKACGALGFLPDWEEPRHDGTGTVTPSPGRVNAVHEPFTPRLQAANTSAEPVVVVGGFLTDTLSWRWVFFINLPIGIAAVLLALRYVHNSRAEERPETVDVAGAVTVTAGLLVLVYDIVKAQQYGWTSGRTLGLGALAALLLVAFVVIEQRSRAPLIRLDIFRIRSLTASWASSSCL